jgi:hypothetical protein
LADVFISYSRADSAFVRELHEFLAEAVAQIQAGK